MSGPFGDRSPYEVIESVTLYPPGKCPESPLGAYMRGVFWGQAVLLAQIERNRRGTPEP